MAHPINGKGILRGLIGLNNHLPDNKGAQLAAGPDNVPAVIHGQDGTPKGPAMIKEGEIVFSVPSVIAAGKGDYDKGAKFLLELHKRLQTMGEQMLAQKQGLPSG